MRPRTKDKHLPRGMYFKHGQYWRVSGGKWTGLGPAYAQALAEYGRLVAPTNGQMDPLFDKVLTALQTRKKPIAKATLDQYKVARRKLSKIFHDFSPGQIQQKHIAAVKLKYADRPNMFNRMLSFLKTCLGYAVEWQIIGNNPAVGLERLPEAKRDRLLTVGEFDAIYAQGSPRLQCMMEIWRLTGQRVMDVVKIRQGDLLPEGIAFKQQKTGAKLIVRWTPELEAAVDRAKGLNGVRSLSLFATVRGKNRGGSPAYGTIRDQWKAACEVAKVENAQLRDLRAVAATEANRQGQSAQKLLGHTTEATTKRYLRDRQTPLVEGPSFRQLEAKAAKGK